MTYGNIGAGILNYTIWGFPTKVSYNINIPQNPILIIKATRLGVSGPVLATASTGPYGLPGPQRTYFF